MDGKVQIEVSDNITFSYFSGGNLAAAVCLELVNDKERIHRPKYQFLTYPATDLITFNHNSHHYYKDDPILSRDRMDAFRLSYLG